MFLRSKTDKQATTELSKHIWAIKDDNKQFDMKWRILGRAKPYNVTSSKCNSCSLDKYFIICHPELSSLNSGTELVNTSRHSRGYTMEYWNG